jgi:hypothetical protein
MDGVMVHSFNSEAWKHFNNVHPHFSMEIRNMHLGLYTDKFDTFESFVAPYFGWLVILTVYNLPPEMCMRSEFIVLSTIILNPLWELFTSQCTDN